MQRIFFLPSAIHRSQGTRPLEYAAIGVHGAMGNLPQCGFLWSYLCDMVIVQMPAPAGSNAKRA
jgi:hypothetical protein